MIRNITTNFIDSKKTTTTSNVLNSSSNQRSTMNSNDQYDLEHLPLNQQQLRQLQQGGNLQQPPRLDSSQTKIYKMLNLVNKEQGMLLDNCTQGQYTRRKKGNITNILHDNLQACYNPEIPTNSYSLQGSFSSKINSLSPLNNRSLSLKKHSVSLHQNTDNLESNSNCSTNRSSLISKNNTISYEGQSFSSLNTLNINNHKIARKKRTHNQSINSTISPKNTTSNNSFSSLPLSGRQQTNTRQLQIYPGQNNPSEDKHLGYNPNIELNIPFERNNHNSSTTPFNQSVLKDSNDDTEFLEKQQVLYPLVMPNAKIIVLDYINNQPGIAVSEIKFKMENHWLKFFSRSARAITDLELLLRVQPYVKKIIKQYHGNTQKKEKNYEKGMLRDCSKWQILSEIQSYERGDLSQTSFEDFITHYFISGSFSQRKQVLETLIESIRKELQYYYPKQLLVIDSLLDIEGHLVEDIFQIDILNPLLIVGQRIHLNSLYNSFKQQINTLACDVNTNKYSIYSLKNPRRQAQQTFDVPEYSTQNSPFIAGNSISSDNNTINPLRLPQIIFNGLDQDKQNSFRQNNNSKDSDNLEKYKVMLHKQQQDFSNKSPLSADERFKFIENKLNFKYAFSLNFKSKVRKKHTKIISISDAPETQKISPKKQRVNSSFVENAGVNYQDDFVKENVSDYSFRDEDLQKTKHEFQRLVSLDQDWEDNDNYSDKFPNLKKSKKPLQCLLTTFLLMDPCFAAKNQKTQKKFLKALEINENVMKQYDFIKRKRPYLTLHDSYHPFLPITQEFNPFYYQHSFVFKFNFQIDDLWSSMLSWPQFLKLKAFTSRNVSISYKIEFLINFFNPDNLLTIRKKEFMESLKDSRGVTPSTKSRQLSYDIFADDIWRRLADLLFTKESNLLIKELLEGSKIHQPAVMLVIDAIFEWMFPIPFQE